MLQFRPERSIPERQDSESQHDENKLIDDRDRHEDDRTVRHPVPVLVHIIELDRLPAGCRRRDPGVEKSDKRILEAPEQAVPFLPHGIEQKPDHESLRADEEHSQRRRRDQIHRRHPRK